ncbi:MAG: hypothetical protein AAGA96_11205 [Verrucomicrobiota bacterium]
MNLPPKLGNSEPRKPQRAGAISLVLGLITFLLAVASIAQAATGFANQYSLHVLLPLTTSLFAIGSLAAGLGSFIRYPNRRQLWTITGMILGGLSLFILGVGVVGVRMAEATRLIASLDFEEEQAPIEISPIELPKESLTIAKYREQWRDWLDKHVVQPRKSEVAGHKHEELIGEILDGYISEITSATETPTLEEWNRLTAQLIRDPGHGSQTSALLAASYSERGTNVIGMQSLIRNFRKKETNPFLIFAMELQRADYMDRVDAESPRLDALNRALAALDEMLSKGWFEGENASLIPHLQSLNRYSLLEDTQGEALLAIFEKHDLPDWLMHYARGERYIDLAWDARGSGYANTVTDEGWAEFDRLLSLANDELTKSWKLAPEYPFAAARMITVSMGAGDDPEAEMRLWFDRAIQASADDPKAFQYLYWGMRPRWHGSRRAMLRLGEEALATGRFDTGVPSQYVAAVKAVADDVDEYWSAFKRPGVYENLERMVQGYIDHGIPPEEKKERITMMTMIAYNLGRYDDVRRGWLELGGDFSRWVENSWYHDPTEFRFRCHFGSGSDDLAKIRRLEEKGNWKKAAERYQEWLEDAELDEGQATFLKRWIKVCELRERFEEGQWVDLIGPEAPDIWLAIAGSYERETSGAVVVRTDTTRYAIEHPLPVGECFEAEITFESDPEMLAQASVGLHFSDRTFDSKRWEGFHLKQHHDGNRSYRLADRRYAAYLNAGAPERKVTTLRLVCRGKKWKAHGDGKLLNYTDLEIKTPQLSKGTRLCLGGWSGRDYEIFSPRYSQLRVRKLKPDEE